jgi:hypothetical protein
MWFYFSVSLLILQIATTQGNSRTTFGNLFFTQKMGRTMSAEIIEKAEREVPVQGGMIKPEEKVRVRGRAEMDRWCWKRMRG